MAGNQLKESSGQLISDMYKTRFGFTRLCGRHETLAHRHEQGTRINSESNGIDVRLM